MKLRPSVVMKIGENHADQWLLRFLIRRLAPSFAR